MATELLLHAYVFLGNALNYLANGGRVDVVRQFGSTPEALAGLYAALEPLTPNDFATGIAALPTHQRQLLMRSAQWTLAHLGTEFSTLTGVSEPEGVEVVAWLEHLPNS